MLIYAGRNQGGTSSYNQGGTSVPQGAQPYGGMAPPIPPPPPPPPPPVVYPPYGLVAFYLLIILVIDCHHYRIHSWSIPETKWPYIWCDVYFFGTIITVGTIL